MLALHDTTFAGNMPWSAIVVGLVVLTVGADLLVRGAVWIALILGMSRMAVGLTLVAIGTSLPELIVSFTAAKGGHDDMAFTNVLGSNAANTLLIVGAAAAICAIRLQTRWLELGWMLIATLLLVVPFLLDVGVERPLSAVMLAMLVAFCVLLLARERRARRKEEAPRPHATPAGWLLHLVLLAAGRGGRKFGADWLVGGAVVVAEELGMSEGLIGLTILAIGTSLPELATSVVAALRRQPEICIGNVLGSNIFNVGLVLGTAGTLRPLTLDHDLLGPAIVVTAVSAVALVVVLRLARGVPRAVGIAFLSCYLGFLGYQAYAEVAAS